MSDRSWSSLAAPFPLASVRWHAVDRSSDGLRVRLAPHLAPEALRARLDEAVGPDGWSLTLTAWGEDALIAELAALPGAHEAAGSGVAGRSARASGAPASTAVVSRAVVSRAVVCRALKLPALAGPDGAGSVSAADAVTGAAWTVAAAAFGVPLPVVVLDDGWVDADPESGEGLHLPEHAASPQADAGAHRATHDRGAASHGPSPTPSRAGSRTQPGAEPSPAAAPAASPSTAGDAAGDSARDAAGDRGASSERGERGGEAAKPDGHQVIDRLVERLRQEGLGADAARLVTSYGGYGGDAEASRELYAKLRALLVQRSART